MYRVAATTILPLLLAASNAFAQIKTHDDYGGYSIRTGNSVYSYRNDGTQQTYHRFGNIGMYSDNAGTTGNSHYMNHGRYDSYSNSREGWSGSGFTPHSGRAGQSTYSRSYDRTSGFGLPPLPELSALPELPQPGGTSDQLLSRPTRKFSARTPHVPISPGAAPFASNGFDTASRLRRLGVNVATNKYTESELLDIEFRVLCAQWIARMGENTDWQARTHAEMLDIEFRISSSKRIARAGESVDWKSHSHSELLDIEFRVSSMNRLKRKGVVVDWRKYTHSNLLEMERLRSP